MKNSFTLFSNHLELASYWWRQLLQPGDNVLDATCGQGRDTLMLAKAVLAAEKGQVWALDIQPAALTATHSRLVAELSPKQLTRLHLLLCDHAKLPLELIDVPLKLAVYNLGYMPKGDKTLITTAAGTVSSIQAVLPQIIPGGALSIMCYIGHPGGAAEYEAVCAVAAQLSSSWNVCCHRWLNAPTAPVWLFLQHAL